MAAPAVGADEAAMPPVTMSNTKGEIVDAAVAAGHFASADDAAGWTKAELLDLWAT